MAAHHRLVSLVRRLGMAQIGGSVLHNVCNVLSGVNVWAALIQTRSRESELGGFDQADRDTLPPKKVVDAHEHA